MTKLYVTYRGEFGAEVEVEDTDNVAEKIEEAIKEFERGNYKIEVKDHLHPEYFEVVDVETEEVLEEMGQ